MVDSQRKAYVKHCRIPDGYMLLETEENKLIIKNTQTARDQTKHVISFIWIVLQLMVNVFYGPILFSLPLSLSLTYLPTHVWKYIDERK